ncbi:MAG TPA: aquaporin [Candidatus Saccharimonadales bacterium]|nr:aquaporin [Candidatus Saccharimonadales bacterium]
MSLTRKKIAMILAEFLGTALLTLAILAVSKSSIGIPYFIAIAAGLVVAMGTLTFGNVSGGHFNPIITIGLWSIRRVKTVPAIVYVAAQLLGGFAAYYLFTYFVSQTYQNVGDFQGRILVAEAAGAFVFSLGWAAVVYQRLEVGKAAAVIGMALMLGIVVSAAGAGGIINPAVALGAKSWVWGTYVLGPVLGAIIGFNLYSLLFAPATELVREAELERANAEAEEAKKEKPAKTSKKK